MALVEDRINVVLVLPAFDIVIVRFISLIQYEVSLRSRPHRLAHLIQRNVQIKGILVPVAYHQQ